MPRSRVVHAAVLAALLVPLSLAAQQRRVRPLRAGPIPGAEMVIEVTDSGCEAPDQIDAGLVNVRLFNRGATLRHVEFIKRDRITSLAQLRQLVLTEDRNVPWLHPIGGPAPAAPGGMSSATLVLERGNYVLACVFAGTPSLRQPFPDGIVKELTVTVGAGAAPTARLPQAELSMRLFEWNFVVDGPLFAGRRTIRVENAGRLEHNVWIVRLLPGRTPDQAAAWVTDPRGAPPFEAAGGSTGLEAQQAINITVDFLPGEYVFLCTLYNPLSRRTHVGHGMMKVVRVVN
jgi:hypothetical protein